MYQLIEYLIAFIPFSLNSSLIHPLQSAQLGGRTAGVRTRRGKTRWGHEEEGRELYLLLLLSLLHPNGYHLCCPTVRVGIEFPCNVGTVSNLTPHASE